MMAIGEDIKWRGSSFITKIGLSIELNWQSRKIFLLRNLSISDGDFFVVNALYLLLSVLSFPALSLRYRCEVTAISCLLAAFNSH